MVRDTNPNDGSIAGPGGTSRSVDDDLDTDDVNDDGTVDTGSSTSGTDDDDDDAFDVGDRAAARAAESTGGGPDPTPDNNPDDSSSDSAMDRISPSDDEPTDPDPPTEAPTATERARSADADAGQDIAGGDRVVVSDDGDVDVEESRSFDAGTAAAARAAESTGGDSSFDDEPVTDPTDDAEPGLDQTPSFGGGAAGANDPGEPTDRGDETPANTGRTNSPATDRANPDASDDGVEVVSAAEQRQTAQGDPTPTEGPPEAVREAPRDGSGLEDQGVGATGPSQANEDRVDQAVERLQGRIDREVPGVLAIETDEYNVVREESGTLRAELTKEGVRDARATIRQGADPRSNGVVGDDAQPERVDVSAGGFAGGEGDDGVTRVDGRKTRILGEDNARNPTDQPLALVEDVAGDEGQRVFPTDDDPLAPDTPEAAAEIGEAGTSDQALNARGLEDTVAGLETVVVDENATVERGSGRSNPRGNADVSQPAAFSDDAVASVAAARALEGRAGDAERVDADAVRDPTLRREAVQEDRDDLGLSRDSEQFGDIDFSAGLGGPEDEVERFVDEDVPEVAQQFSPEQRDLLRDAAAETVPGFSSFNRAAEISGVDESIDRGVQDAATGYAELPAQGLEASELALYITDATPAAGGSEAQFDRRIDQVGSAAAGRAVLAAQAAENDPVRTGTAFVAGSAAEAGTVGAISRLGSAGRLASTGTRSTPDATIRTAGTYSPDVDAVGEARRFAAADRGQLELAGGEPESPSVEVDDQEALAQVEDASAQRAAQAGFRGSRRAQNRIDDPGSEINDPADATPIDDAADRGVSPGRDPDVVEDSVGGDFVASAEVEPTPRAGEADVSRFARQRADETGVGLSPRQSQLARELDPQTTDLRRAADVEQRLAAQADAGQATRVDVVGAAVGGGVAGALERVDQAQEPSVGAGTDAGLGSDIGADADVGVGPAVETPADTATRVDTAVRSDVASRVDTRLRTDVRADTAARADTRLDTRSRVDTRFESDARLDSRSEFDSRIDTRVDADVPEQVDSTPDVFGDERDDEALDFENPIATPGGFLF